MWNGVCRLRHKVSNRFSIHYAEAIRFSRNRFFLVFAKNHNFGNRYRYSLHSFIHRFLFLQTPNMFNLFYNNHMFMIYSSNTSFVYS